MSQQIEESIRSSTFKLPFKLLSTLNNQNNSIINKDQSFKEPSTLTNNSSTKMSKLHQYFSSSQYLSCQQQLSIFIQNFPIINIQSSHKSINQILPLLIRQNELLSKKCQSQVLLIKQSFSKHESINKQSKKIKEEMELVQSQCQELLRKKEEEIVEGMKRMDEVEKRIKLYEELINQQNSIMRHIVNSEYKKGEQMTNFRSTRIAYDQFMAYHNNPQNQQTISQPSNINNPSPSSLTLIPLQQLQKYCKQSRKRTKYYSRVKSSVQQFCNRLIKISTIVPGEMLAKELGHECGQFVEVVSELISCGEGGNNGNGNKRKREESVKSVKRKQNVNSMKQEKKLMSMNSEQSLFSKSQLQALSNQHQINRSPHNNNNNLFIPTDKQSTILLRPTSPSPFQFLLSTFLTQSTTNYQQVISSLQVQLQDITNQLQTSKEYYQTYLINAKLQYETKIREFQEQATIKDEMCKHFEEELERCFAVKEQLDNRVFILTKQNQQMTKRQSPLKQQIQHLTQQLNQKQQSITKHITKHNTLQSSFIQQLSKKQLQFQSFTQKLQLKLHSQQRQHQQQINKKNTIIKNQQQQITTINQEIRTLKQTIEDKNVQLSRLTKRLNLIEQDQVHKLQHQVATIQHEIISTKKTNKQLFKTIDELHQQLSLNTTYMKQLQSKSQKKDQAIDKLNKKLLASELQLKSLKSLKQTNQKLQSQLHQLNSQLKKSLQDNSNLKKLAKQMKKQLQQVYHTINDLKSIQKDRERLVLDNQKSQRWKQQIMKDYDQMKYQILKVEAENKSLALQVKHYKNALKRIEMIN